MTKLHTTLFAGALLVGAGTAASADPRRELGTAQGFDIALASTVTDQARTRTDDDGIERLRQTDEENTNEQAAVVFIPGTMRGWYFHMRTSPINEGTAMESSPEFEMQAALSAIEVGVDTDGSFTVKRPTDAPYDVWATDNDGEENRNSNKLEGYSIMGGKYLALEFNYRPEGAQNTDRWVRIFTQDLQPVPVNGQTQVRVMNKNNDDCSGGQDGAGRGMVVYDSATKTKFFGWDLCNGNGNDDGWGRMTQFECTGDGATAACTHTRVFDISLAQQEERTRGRCSVGGADRSFAVCSWTEGDDQPARQGVWLAAVDISEGGETGSEAQSRLLWKERIQKNTTMLVNGEEREYYAMRANHTREMALQTDGTIAPTNHILYTWGLNRGGNNNDHKGGRSDFVMGAVYEVTRESYVDIAPMTNLQPLLLGFENTHTAVTEAIYGKGTELKPGFSLLVGDHTGGTASASSIRTLMFDPATKEWKNLGQHSLGRAYDRHLYSNYLGNNPGFQGRNFAHCQLVQNQMSTVNNNNVTFFQACAVTGKAAQHQLSSIKGSAFLTIFPVAFTKEAPPPGGDWNEDELPGEDGSDDGDDDGSSPGTSVGGCSTSGGSTGLLVGLAFLGLAITRRRK